ncbi:predicted protein [Pediculus humanus corporis]|uniref:Predicted protein n=1 Tax=Pediculus humanus subsp. corporis TaxID=121224 RepID=E0VG21_PEDHC|nr:uncharacterized protein Phum_PHUM171540 [Pediculus humanus corporis]EEB12327.1 predicted protein [Pediculus humanus corporis]
MFTYIYFLLTLTYVFGSKNNNVFSPSKQFSDTYSVKGTLNIPYAEIKEPFYAWYDLEKGLGRIDYYGGMVKTYQLGSEGQYGTLKKVAPVTTEKFQNVDTCFVVSGSSESPVEPQTVLPDISNFEYAGEDTVNEIPCHKWTLTNKFGDKVNRYTMWTSSKVTWKSNGETTAVPVRYEMKGFNSLLGSHYDHYYLDYDWYSPESPDSKVFELSKNVSCTSFHGNGLDHVYTFNPMKEFVHNYDKHVRLAFEDFKMTHGKTYNSPLEHAKRLNLFRQNLRFINSHNRAGKSFQLGVNHLADKDDVEIRALRGNRYTPGVEKHGDSFPYPVERIHEMKKDLPESLDWRLNGAVTPVKDQSVCGSCWSFGSTGAIEGAYFLKNHKLVRVSQQALIDCSWGFGNGGCDGGEDSYSFDYILKHGGIPTEDSYGPYLGQDGYCHVNKSMDMVKIKGYVAVPSGDVDALKVAVAVHGPVGVAIDASHKTFSFYSNGVYYDPNCGNTPNDLDHAVLVVGFGKLNGEDYWLVKNSWSNYWGNDGYVLMSQKNNNCVNKD